MLTAKELHRRGLEATNTGRPAQARQFLRRAMVAEAVDVDTSARILVTLAHVESELGSVDRGMEICDRALAVEGISDPVAGLAHSQRALLWMRAGNGTAALEEFRQAERLLDNDPAPWARLHLHRGMVHLQRADAAKAKSDFKAAVEWGSRTQQPVLQAKAEFNLGYTYLLTGELVTALQMMDEAKPILDPLSPVTRAINEQDRAEVLVAAGMIVDAEEALRASARAFGLRRLRQRQGEAEVVLARMLLRNDPAEAARTARRAMRRFRARGSAAWAARAESIELTALIENGRGTPAVVDRARRVVDELRQHGLGREAARLDLEVARAAIVQGDLDTARARVRRFHATESSPLELRLLHREVRAELSHYRHRRSEALRQIRSGLADLHDWQSSFGSLDLQSSLVGHGRRLALQGLQVAVEDGRPEVVFEWAERARTLASRVTPVRPPSDPEAAAELTALRSAQAELAAAEAAGRMTPALQRRVSELRRRIRQRQWYGKGSGEVVEPASLAEVAGALRADGAVLIAYLRVGDRLDALSVDAHSAELQSLGDLAEVRRVLAGMQADLDMSATQLPQALRSTVQAGLRARLEDLADRLVAPLLEHLGDRRLVVVPSGALAGVPWTLLPGLFGRPLTVPRSATAWLTTRPDGHRAASAGLVAGPRVDRAAEEVEAAAKAWGHATIVRQDRADAARVRDLASSVDVFHVAAHGRHSADNPLFSGLELADGPWFGYDIDQLDAIPSTVILSACELGRSSIRWGEETIGMTVAWLHAGARTVIASPASVDDDVACYTLAATHHYLAAGRPPADALATAMVDVGGPIPAPFVCFGSG